MRTRRLLTLPVIVIVALAFVLGSVGTATAGGLTKGAVKKIATKVVNKKASSLSVSYAGSATTADSAKTAASATNATTAGNANNLAGQSASAYQNPTYKYTLPTAAPASSATYKFPGLPNGTYLMSFAVLTSTSTTNSVACYSSRSSSDQSDRFYGLGANATNISAATGAGTIVVAGTVPQLDCYSIGTSGTWSIYSSSSFPSVVSFTRVDTSSALAPALTSSHALLATP